MIARLRRGLLAAALVLAVGAALAPAVSTPARADDLTTCIGGWAKKAMNPDDIALALDFMAKHGDCIGKLADPSGRFAAIVTALGALKKAGQFNTENDCKGMISSLLGEVVIQVSNTVGSVIGLKVPAYIESQGKDAVVSWVEAQANSNPVISAIKADMDCGCAVAAVGVDYLEDLLKTLVEVAEACAGLIGDIAKIAEKLGEAILGGLSEAGAALGGLAQDTIELLEDCLTAAAGQKSVMDCLGEIPDVTKAIGALLGTAAETVGDFFDALGGVLSWAKPACCGTVGKIWGGFCGGCSKPAKPKQPKVDIGCQGVACAKGFQCGGELRDRCVPCTTVAGPGGGFSVAQGVADGYCGCVAGFKPSYMSTPGGPVLSACTCEAPKVMKKALVVAVCACPNQGETVLYNNTGQAYCGCPWGEDLKGGKCQPIVCKPPFSLASNGKTCVQTEPVYLPDPQGMPAKATPVIPPCPPNYRFDGGKCVYGGPFSLKDQPKQPAKATPVLPGCPPGYLWTGSVCLPIGTAVPGKPGPAKAAPVVPACPANTKWNGRTCASTVTIQKAPRTTIKTVPPQPQCPPNTKWNGQSCVPTTTIQRAPTTFKAAPLIPACPPNTRWDGKRCAPAVPPPIQVVPRSLNPAAPNIR